MPEYKVTMVMKETLDVWVDADDEEQAADRAVEDGNARSETKETEFEILSVEEVGGEPLDA